MATEAVISDSAISADAVLIESIMFALRDNWRAGFQGNAAEKVQAAALASGAALANIGAGAITQGYFNTSLGSVSGSGNTFAALPGGQYGFWPQVRFNTNGTGFVSVVGSNSYTGSGWTDLDPDGPGTIFQTRIKMATTGSSVTAYAQQRYINSSPPYNLGDGDIPEFIFARVNSSGDVTATYVADVPPWAYNGPTDVRATRIDFATGRKFQAYKRMNSSTGDIESGEMEVTHSIKNADMGLIPHPFDLKPGETIVLLDPVETLELKDLHECGESVCDLLHDGELIIDNMAISRAAPPGVMPVPIRWKNTIQKWRAAPKIAAKLTL